MKRAILLALSLLCVATPSAARAQPTSNVQILRNYQFLPRFSALNQSGGFGGFDVDFRVYGKFGLVNGFWNPAADAAYAKFVDVNAWASHPILAYVLDLDQTLNLSGLRGYPLPVAAPFDVLKFEGKSNDGSQVNLFASVIGPWLYLRGGTTPPPNTADYFSYNLKALARQRPWADVDQNDVVDNADLAKMMARFGLNPAGGASSTLGDTDGDRDVDGGDFLAWQRQAGETPPLLEDLDAMVDAAIASVPTVALAPEPGAGALFALGSALFAVRRRR